MKFSTHLTYHTKEYLKNREYNLVRWLTYELHNSLNIRIRKSYITGRIITEEYYIQNNRIIDAKNGKIGICIPEFLDVCVTNYEIKDIYERLYDPSLILCAMMKRTNRYNTVELDFNIFKKMFPEFVQQYYYYVENCLDPDTDTPIIPIGYYFGKRGTKIVFDETRYRNFVGIIVNPDIYILT